MSEPTGKRAGTGLLLRAQRVTPPLVARVLVTIALIAVATGVVSLLCGSVSISLTGLLDDTAEARMARDVLFDLRLPRLLAAFAVGGLLGLSGALMQVLLRNPLADPYILGVSGGASVGAILAMLMFGSGVWVSGGAGIGALSAIAVVFSLARGDQSWTQARLLLTGVAVAAFCGALTSLLLSLAPDGILRGMIFWMLGDLSGSDWRAAMLVLCATLAAVLPFARDLNIFTLGTQQAHSLGVSVTLVRNVVYVGAALATAAAVTTAGMIGFIGLLVPHALRLVLGNDQRLLLPAAVLGGGTLLMLADLASRTLIAPQQLPVGVITASLGAPFFLLLLHRSGR